MSVSARFWVVMVVALAAIPRRAGAAMMAHYDLAGLIAQSDAVVLAERGELQPNDKGTTLRRFKIVRVLRGTYPGDHVDVWDCNYIMTGHQLDPSAVLFFRRTAGGEIELDGMRVVAGGKVFRFEQLRNPGLAEMVPQGEDPVDNWRGGTTQIDLAELEREIALAAARVDAARLVAANPDLVRRRAMALDLVPAPSDVTAHGFYDDVLTHQLEATLVAAGDLEGALLLDQRDHTARSMRRGFGETAALLAIAGPGPHPAMPRAPAEGLLRVTALEVAIAKSELATPATERAAIALLADPDPRVRAAAVALVYRPIDQESSDHAEQTQLVALRRAARAALAARYPTETDPTVLAALIDAAHFDHGRTLPAHASPPIGARLRLDSGTVELALACPHAMQLAHLAITATPTPAGGAPIRLARYSMGEACRDGKEDTVADPGELTQGRYQISVAVDVDGRRVEIPLGAVSVDRIGQLQAAP